MESMAGSVPLEFLRYTWDCKDVIRPAGELTCKIIKSQKVNCYYLNIDLRMKPACIKVNDSHWQLFMNETRGYPFSGSVHILILLILCLIPLQIVIDKRGVDGSKGAELITSGANASNPYSSNLAGATYSNSSDDNASRNYTMIFDGKTLEGWRIAGDGKFVVVPKDKSIQSDGGLGILWYTKQKYGDFDLRLEWKVSEKDDNSGIFVRFPELVDDVNAAVLDGYEIQIKDTGEDSLYKTGAIAGIASPKNVTLKPVNQWNTMEIRAVGQSYSVFINGQNVNEFTGHRLTEGYIGLQVHDKDSKVSFRNITVSQVLPED